MREYAPADVEELADQRVLDAVVDGALGASALDHALLAEDPELLRRGRGLDLKLTKEIADAHLAVAEEFEHASDTTRAAWAWRAYVSAARTAYERVLEIRYEQLATDPAATAELLAEHLDAPYAALHERLRDAHPHSVGRHKLDLDWAQLADVEREAGALLDSLGYGAD